MCSTPSRRFAFQAARGYPTLRSGREEVTRLHQILDWAGEVFEGVVAFDEAHALANVAGGEGSRGRIKGSEQGLAGLRLQNRLPRARVLYVSATGASDVANLSYASRLGMWGPGTAFATRKAFITGVRAGGIAAMELVARDLKALGLYTARALSFGGVEYDLLEHALTPEQIRVYDAYAEAWAIIHRNLSAALEATRVVDSASGSTLNANAKSAALSRFESVKQRFFAQLLLSAKLPSLLPAIAADLEHGNAVVVQLVSTSEAMLDRRLADLDPAERESLEIDLSPREYVVDYLVRAFPTRQMRVFTDPDGNVRSDPMVDDQGYPVHCRAAIEARDSMVEQLCALPPVATALDAILERFGTDRVAEVTGLRMVNGGGKAEAQAAHIWSVADGGPDVVQNGIALSATAHWLFDRHLISLDEECRLLVSHNKVPSELIRLFPQPGERVHLPADPRLHPRPDYVARHRARFAGLDA